MCGTVAAVREHTETVIEVIVLAFAINEKIQMQNFILKVLLGAPVDCVPASTFTSPPCKFKKTV